MMKKNLYVCALHSGTCSNKRSSNTMWLGATRKNNKEMMKQWREVSSEQVSLERSQHSYYRGWMAEQEQSIRALELSEQRGCRLAIAGC